MKQKVTAIRTKQMTSQRGPWSKIEVKFEATGDEVHELKGFNQKYPPRVGDLIGGYFTERTWSGGSVRVFNKITADYIYELLEQKGLIDSNPTAVVPSATQTPAGGGWGDAPTSPANDGWGGAPLPESQGDDNW